MEKRFLRLQSIFLILVVVVIIGGLTWANIVFTRAAPVEKDFLIPWLGARTYVQYGVDPYGVKATQRAQIVFYGRLAEESEDPLYLSISMPVHLFYFPYALVDDYAVARGLWMTMGELALIAAGFLCVHLTGWKPSFLVKSVMLIFLLLWLYSIQLYLRASPGAWVFLGIVGALVALKDHKDDLAGAVLSLVLLEPVLSLPFMIFIVWWTMRTKRWRLWWGFLVTFASIFLFSFIVFPSWFLPFFRNKVASLPYLETVNVGGLLTQWWPSFGTRLGLFLSIALALLLVIEIRRLQVTNFRNTIWVACMVQAVAPLLDLPTYLDGHIFLFLPIVLILSTAGERWQRLPEKLIASGFFVAFYGLLWLLMVDFHLLFLIPPVLILVGLYWMRWWSIQPARTWIDSIRS